ncbi:MAG: hypothetical protein WAZ40_02035 [Minisyncoccia bacterium]
MNINKKTIILLGIAVTAVLVSGGAYFFIFRATKDKVEATALLSDKIEELSGKESRVASSMATLRKEALNIEKMSSAFFRENENIAFLKEIEALGPQSSTILTIESFEPGVVDKTSSSRTFRIKATGKFQDVSRLMLLLENFPGKLDLRTLRLVRDTPLDETASLASATSSKEIKSSVSKLPTWTLEASLVALNFIVQTP